MTESLDRLTAALSRSYRLERELGAGGMATVYLAQDLKHDRKVAVKVLRPELAAVPKGRIDREAHRAAGRARFQVMPNSRSDMTVRIVSLHSAEASDSRVGGTVAERLALVTSLSETLWALTRRPLPVYTRGTMPIVLSSIRARSDRD